MLMTDTVISYYWEVIAALSGGNSFLFSFIVGAAAIALHSKDRLKIAAPRGEEYDFVRLLSLPALVGKAQFRKSFLLYTASLEVVYLILCLSQPLLPLGFFGNTPEFKATGYVGATWPMAAALGVVGLLPSVPGFSQVENWLREWALSINDIPNSFYRRVTRLSQGEIGTFLQRGARYGTDLNRYWRVHNLVLAAGLSPQDAHEAARRVVGFDLFARWTLDGGAIWSLDEYDKLQEIFDILRPKTRGTRNEIDKLIVETAGSKVVEYVASTANINLNRQLTVQEIQAVSDMVSTSLAAGKAEIMTQVSAAELAAYQALLGRWKEKSEELLVSNRRLSGIFAVLALNDRGVRHSTTVRNDAVLQEMLSLVDRSVSKNLNPLQNAWLSSSIVGFVACLVGVTAYKYLAPSDADPFVYSLFVAVTLGVACLFAGLSALVIRNTSIDKGDWLYFEGFLSIPLFQYRGVFFTASAFAFAIMTGSTLLDTLQRGGDLTKLNSLGAVISFLLYPAAWSLIPATLAVALCCIADWSVRKGSDDTGYGVALIFSSLVLLMSFMVHLSYQTVNEQYRSIFGEKILSVGIFACFALVLFGMSLRANARNSQLAGNAG